MKKIMSITIAAVAVCCAMSGCISNDAPDLHDLEAATQMLIDKMSHHPQFTKNYGTAKALKGKEPVLCISPIKNNTSLPEGRAWGRTVDEHVRVMLFDTGLFEVKDDDSADVLQSRIIWGVDGRIENMADVVKTLGTHDAPDFMVAGDIKPSKSIDGYPTYRLRLALHSLKTGKVVWEGIQSKVKP